MRPSITTLRALVLAALLARAAPQPVVYTHASSCTVAGLVRAPTGATGSADGTGSSALFNRAAGLALSAAGDVLYVGDGLNARLRRVNLTTNATTTVATGLSAINDIAMGVDGAIYVANVCAIKRVTPAGVVATWAGNNTCAVVGGDGFANTTATFSFVRALAPDATGALWVADGALVRLVAANQSVVTIAGGHGCANGVGTAARFNLLAALALSPDGSVLYLFDYYCYWLRRMSVATAAVTVLAGRAAPGWVDGPPTLAYLSRVGGGGLTVDAATGSLYFTDGDNFALRAAAPSGTVVTLVGSGTAGLTNGNASVARFLNPSAVRYGGSGILYVADYSAHNVRVVRCAPTLPSPPPTPTQSSTTSSTPTQTSTRSPSPTPTPTTTPTSTPQLAAGVFAGTAPGATTVAANMLVVTPRGLCLDGSASVIFITRHCLRRVGLDGSAATLAGDCASVVGVWAGDGGPAANASFFAPAACAVGAAGVYVAEGGTVTAGNGRVRLLNVSSGNAQTVAGNGGYSTGAINTAANATAQPLGTPAGLALAADGATLYIADSAANVILALAPGGALSVLAGTNIAPRGTADAGDGGAATAARVAPAGGLALAPPNARWPGALYVSDKALSTVRAVLPNGTIILVAGVNGFKTTPSTAGLVANANPVMAPTSLAFDAAGALLVLEMVTAPSPVVRRVWPNGSYGVGWGGGSNNADGNVGAAIGHYVATSLVYDAARAVGYVTEGGFGRVRVVRNNVVGTLAGPWAYPAAVAGAAATSIELYNPQTLAYEPVSGALIVPETSASLVRLVAPSGVLLPRWVGFPTGRVAGAGMAGDGGNATAALIQSPFGVAADGVGGYFVAMSFQGNGTTRVARVFANGTISTAVGGGTFSGSTACSGGLSVDASAAGFLVPLSALAWDTAAMALYIVEQGAGVVRRWSATTNLVTVFAGTCGSNAFAATLALKGNGGPATSARLYQLSAVAVDPAGNLLIGESTVLWIVNISNGSSITAIAGTGTSGNSGNGGPAKTARVGLIRGIVFDSCGQLFFSDLFGIRRISPYPSGTITQVPAPAFSSAFSGAGLAIDASGRLFAADSAASVVRVIPPGFAAACAPPSMTPTSTASGTGTASATGSASATPSSTVSGTGSETPRPTPTESGTSSLSATATSTATPSSSTSTTTTPTATAPTTAMPTSRPTPSTTATQGTSAAATVSRTGSPAASLSSSATPSGTLSATGTASVSETPTVVGLSAFTPSASMTATLAPTVTASPTATPKETLSAASIAPTPMATPTPSTIATMSGSSVSTSTRSTLTPITSSSSPTATLSSTVTHSTTSAAGLAPAATATPTASDSSSSTASPTATSTATPTASDTSSTTHTSTSTATQSTASATTTQSTSTSMTVAATPTVTALATLTVTASATPTVTASATPSVTASVTPTVTALATASASVSATMTMTSSMTASLTGSATASASATGSVTQSLLGSTSHATLNTLTSTPSPSSSAAGAGVLADAAAGAARSFVVSAMVPFSAAAGVAAALTLAAIVYAGRRYVNRGRLAARRKELTRADPSTALKSRRVAAMHKVNPLRRAKGSARSGR